MGFRYQNIGLINIRRYTLVQRNIRYKTFVKIWHDIFRILSVMIEDLASILTFSNSGRMIVSSSEK
jgi:hypothetical protein